MAKDVTLTAIIKKLQEKKTQVPLVIMTYINPVYQYGIEAFVKDLAETSVKGLIIPDLPNEHADFITPYLRDSDIALVPLVSLTTGIDRQKQLINGAEALSTPLPSMVLLVRLVITVMTLINTYLT